jgi:hypothetical protein
MKKLSTRVGLTLFLLGIGSQAWPQADPATGTNNGAMVAPAPVSGEGYSLEFASETPRTNFLSGGLTFQTAYGSGIPTGSSSPVSDESYSISPSIGLNITRSRLRWDLSYSPGFTFYQKYTDLNQSTQNVATKLSYRLSPHVTFSAQEVFSKSLGGYLQGCQDQSGSLCGPLNAPNTSVVPPITDTITDATNAQLTYQFSPGGMVGVTGNFSQLRYPNQAPGLNLNNSNAAGGTVYYTHRLSGKHYIGTTYEYQKYLTHPAELVTTSQSVMLFYTFYLQKSLTFSLFGGPQYSDSFGAGLEPVRSWSPGGGGSVNWQGQHNSMVANFSRRISDGGGLQGAVTFTGVDASFRHRFTPALRGSLSGNYGVNKVLNPLALNNNSGHTLSGTASVERSFGEHFNLTAGYTRLHQTYDNIAVLSGAPNQDRVWLSIGYQFQKALGR